MKTIEIRAGQGGNNTKGIIKQMAKYYSKLGLVFN